MKTRDVLEAVTVASNNGKRWATYDEIAWCLGRRNDKSLRKSLAMLRKRGAIVRLGQWGYPY